jgi:hypothetical protein
MQHKKLIELLIKLSPDQMDRLSDFMHSPYFNKVDMISALFDYLRKCHPHYTEENTSNELISKAIRCPGDDKWLAKRTTKLLDLIEKFLSMEYAGNEVMDKIGVIKAYKKLQLPKHFESTANELRKALKNEPFRDFDHLWLMHKMEEEAFEGFDKVLLRTPENPANEVLETLRRFYLTKKLRYMTDAVYRERLLGVSIDDSNKKEVKEFIEKNANESDMYLLIYGSIYLMHISKDEEAAMQYYQRVKAIIKASAENIPDVDIYGICVHLQNYCIKHINEGNKEYLREFIEIVQLRIAKNVLTEDGRLNPQLYKNIVGCSLMLNDFEWTEAFIKDFKDSLPEKYKNDYYHLALGQLFYMKKNYLEASQHLSIASHNKNDVYFGFSVKKLLLKIGFESDNMALDPYMDAYRKHLERYRSKIGENAAILEKFFKYFKYLEKARWSQKEMELFLNRLLEEENFVDKDWLIEMACARLKRPLPNFQKVKSSSKKELTPRTPAQSTEGARY